MSSLRRVLDWVAWGKSLGPVATMHDVFCHGARRSGKLVLVSREGMNLSRAIVPAILCD